jgi:hypothetical protein
MRFSTLALAGASMSALAWAGPVLAADTDAPISATAVEATAAGALAENAATQDGAQNASASQPTPTSQPTPANQRSFGERLFDAYAAEFNQPTTAPAGQTAETPAGRLPPPFPPAPLDSPPWPWTDWPFGGTPLLGGATPNSSGNNLMKALGGTSFGDFLHENNVEIWGWVDGGANLSTSKGQFGNLPAGYDYSANTAVLNQAVAYVERVPDTTQQDHIDWGFRLVGLYGTDYRFVTMEGVFSDQLLKHNRIYGGDLADFFFDLYIPGIGQGTDVRVGRYVTLPDIEADLSLQNAFDSHSLYYTYDPFTQMGIIASTRLNKNWMIQYGVNASNDTAIWARSAKPTFTACLQWNSDSSRDNVYLCDNGTNNGKYGYNNVQFYCFTWYHKLTDRLLFWTEDYYEYQNDVPTVATIAGANPALCKAGTQCWAGAYAAGFYVMYQISDRDYVGTRDEAFDDARGQRTGFATWYSEDTFGWTHWLTKSIMVRPEIRYDHSYEAAAYDNGTRRSQVTFASDLLVKF